MANRPIPYFARDRTAAALMDMKTAEFLANVAAGHFPRGTEIAPGVVRWNTEDLRTIASGKLAVPERGLEL